jgi:hypothetical protein
MGKKVKMPIIEVHVRPSKMRNFIALYVTLKNKTTGNEEHRISSANFDDEWEAFLQAVDIAYKLGAFLFVDDYCYGKLNK